MPALNPRITEPRQTDENHPADCGGTYMGIGFMDAAQQRHRARCINHGNRLVETVVRHGPYEYVEVLESAKSEGR